MATIKAIESRSVHQIQSGQVIVDLSSVVKELVENSLDAGATSIEIRFKNHGADSIEVQDNGNGIAPEDFETVALKHYTSKLSSYDDLDSLDTFGFRGEALSSLCALSKFHILTARAQDGAVGKKLDFEVSGKLKSTSVAAAQKGTTIFVGDLFHNLPVRRKELEKNIKREYGKVVSYLYGYACISTGVRFTVSNQVTKGKKTIVFQTKANTSTRENISNIFGVKALATLLALDLSFQLEASGPVFQRTQTKSDEAADSSRSVRIEGHISKPIFGEGRQAPDRQMFFVNNRPCLLPQIAKAVNEVYRSFNISQTPFIFANLIMDTNSYDVNVSPDKRTILLHDQTALLENLKDALTELFGQSEQTVPQASLRNDKTPGSRTALTMQRLPSTTVASDDHHAPDILATNESADGNEDIAAERRTAPDSPSPHSNSRNACGLDVVNSRGESFGYRSSDEQPRKPIIDDTRSIAGAANDIEVEGNAPALHMSSVNLSPHNDIGRDLELLRNEESRSIHQDTTSLFVAEHSDDDSDDQALPSMYTQNASKHRSDELVDITRYSSASQPASSGPIQRAFDRMRPNRPSAQTAEITIGSHRTTAVLGEAHAYKKRRTDGPTSISSHADFQSSPLLAQLRRKFAAPGTQLDSESESPPTAACTAARIGQSSDLENSDDEMANSIDARTRESSSDSAEPESVAFASRSMQKPATVHDLVNDEAESATEDISDDPRSEPDIDHTTLQQSRDMLKRASQLMKNSSRRKDSTLNLATSITLSINAVKDGLRCMSRDTALKHNADGSNGESVVREDLETTEAENKLSLIVSKADFGTMRVVGQFNLGFILAVRPSQSQGSEDDLFIIDQHAADEKYNYERLQHSVVLHSQRLARPKVLELTAYEQEVVLHHDEALKANGFEIESTCFPTGNEEDEDSLVRSFQLLTLPTSHQTTFTVSDLEELIHLLSEEGSSSSGKRIPRPTKVQKMLAMRACRSSIMVGKTLTTKQMTQVARNMGEMEKPWNCPHGRPTMRHLARMGGWKSWQEGDLMDDDNANVDEGYAMDETSLSMRGKPAIDWQQWLDDMKDGA